MRNKSTNITILVLVLMLISIPCSYAYKITLDGISNATWWSADKTKTYLNVRNVTDSNYYYQWQYDGSTPLQWSNIGNMIADLNTKGFDWWLESGGDPFNDPSAVIWKSLYLKKGLYEINLTYDSRAYNLMDYWGDNMWNAYVQIWAGYGDSFNFGEGFTTFGTENDALSYYRTNVNGMRFSLSQDTDLYFYINDYNSIDNSGSVSLDISAVPEPSTVLLLGMGISLAIIWRHRYMRGKRAVQLIK